MAIPPHSYRYKDLHDKEVQLALQGKIDLLLKHRTLIKSNPKIHRIAALDLALSDLYHRRRDKQPQDKIQPSQAVAQRTVQDLSAGRQVQVCD